jgi:hypothetical protein
MKIIYRDFNIKTFLRKDSPHEKWYYNVTLALDSKELDTRELYFDNWSLEDFKMQWREGLGRLKTYNKSCIVTYYYNADPLSKIPNVVGVDMWAFFKKGNELCIIPQILGDKASLRKFKKTLFTRENCYEFIRPQIKKRFDEYGCEYEMWFCKYDPKQIDSIIDELQNPDASEDMVKDGDHESYCHKVENHCCYELTESINATKSPFRYIPNMRRYIVNKNKSGTSFYVITYCPWCGKKLPEDLGDLFTDILITEYQLSRNDIYDNVGIPEEFKIDEWWKKRGL